MKTSYELHEEIYKFSFNGGYHRTVCCHPKKLLYAVGECTGKLSFYTIENCVRTGVVSLDANSNRKSVVTACQYFKDGSKIVCSTIDQKLHLVDVETNKIVKYYNNSTYKTALKSGLAIDGSCEYLVAATNSNGKGITWFDIRNPSPIRFTDNLHFTWIPDMNFVPSSWYSNDSSPKLASICTDGQLKVVNLDGKSLAYLDSGHCFHSLAISPPDKSHPSVSSILVAVIVGERVLTYLPNEGFSNVSSLPQLNNGFKILFNNSGNRVFVGCEDGTIRRYRYVPNTLLELNSKLTHNSSISDMSISCDDEYLVSTSDDGAVIVTKVGLVENLFN